jgi:hypothetical protein
LAFVSLVLGGSFINFSILPIYHLTAIVDRIASACNLEFVMSAVLDGQVALVTGAGRGIDRACAEGLTEADVRVIATARPEDVKIGYHSLY